MFRKRPTQEELNDRLIWSADGGRIEQVLKALAAGADVHTRDDIALCMAAENGHADVVKALLAAGADVNANDDEVLRDAAWRGHAEVVRTLLAAGANVLARDDQALWFAASRGHADIAELLRAASPLLTGSNLPEIERGPKALARLLSDAAEEQARMGSRPSPARPLDNAPPPPFPALWA